jgi:hypothetical protein
MIVLTPSEAIKLMSHCMKEARIFGDFPMTEKEKQDYNMHCDIQDNLRKLDPDYIKKRWYRFGNEPVKRTQDEITEISNQFIKQMISERPDDFDLFKEVDSFDPIENFKKSTEHLRKKK